MRLRSQSILRPYKTYFFSFPLHASWMSMKFSSRRHYGNMDAEGAPGQGLEMQQPPAVFADGNVVAANGQNMMFDNNPAVFVGQMQGPSCASRCCVACGVIVFVSLTAIFAIIASAMGGLLIFSAGRQLCTNAMPLIPHTLCRGQPARHGLYQGQHCARNSANGIEWFHARDGRYHH